MAGILIGSGNEQAGIMVFVGNKCFVTKRQNKQGTAIEQGQMVTTGSTTGSVKLTASDGNEATGVVFDASIANDAYGLIVVKGICLVAMEDNTAATIEFWLRTSISEAGYGNAETANPPGGGVGALDTHFKECGHCLESVGAGGVGAHILALCDIQFN